MHYIHVLFKLNTCSTHPLPCLSMKKQIRSACSRTGRAVALDPGVACDNDRWCATRTTRADAEREAVPRLQQLIPCSACVLALTLLLSSLLLQSVCLTFSLQHLCQSYRRSFASPAAHCSLLPTDGRWTWSRARMAAAAAAAVLPVAETEVNNDRSSIHVRSQDVPSRLTVYTAYVSTWRQYISSIL